MPSSESDEFEKPSSPGAEANQSPGAPSAGFEPIPGTPETSPPPAFGAAEAVQGSWQAAWGLVKSDPVPVFLGGILAAFLSGVTIGILAGAMAWGFYAMCFQRLRAGQPMKLEAVFSQFHRFGTSFLTGLLSFLAVAVGLVLLVVPGLYAAVVFLYALPIAMDENTDAVEALRRSRNRVHATGFWPHAAILATLALVGGIFSRVFAGALNLVWYAFAMTVVACAYEMYIRPRAVLKTH